MKTLTSALLIATLGLSQWANGSTKTASATFEATFEIAEVCAVESNFTNPVVNCQYNSPYTTQHAETSGNGYHMNTASRGSHIWTVTF
jgi:hypothetical protein